MTQRVRVANAGLKAANFSMSCKKEATVAWEGDGGQHFGGALGAESREVMDRV